MIRTCGSCGGTGDRFDDDTEAWVTPWEACMVCGGTGEVGPKRVPPRDATNLYDMGARITQLILNRQQALSLLYRSQSDSYVLAAIAVLEREPEPGERGGAAREQATDILDRLAPGKRRKGKPDFTDVDRVAELLGRNFTDEQIAEALDMRLPVVQSLVGRVMARLRNERTVLGGARRAGMKGVR